MVPTSVLLNFVPVVIPSRKRSIKKCVHHTWCGIGNVENIIHCYKGNNGLVQRRQLSQQFFLRDKEELHVTTAKLNQVRC